VLGGNTSRNPEFKFQYFTEAPLINSLIALETKRQVPAEVQAYDRELAPAVLRHFGISHVVLHTDEVPLTMQSYLEATLPLRAVWQEGPLAVYQVEPAPLTRSILINLADPLGHLARGEGWGTPDVDGEWVWAQRQAVRLFVPLAKGTVETVLRFRAWSPGPDDEQRIEVELNGWSSTVPLKHGWGEYQVTLPAQTVRPGLNEVHLRFARLYPIPLDGPAEMQVGSTGLQSPVAITVRSAGMDVGNFGHVYVNGIDVSPNRRGYNVVVLNPGTGAVEKAAAFDTHLDETASAHLAAFLMAVPEGRIVAVAAADEASRLLGEDAVLALQSIGAAGDLRGCWRCSHAVLGVKGTAPGWALESLSQIRPATIAVGGGVTEPHVAAAMAWVEFESGEEKP